MKYVGLTALQQLITLLKAALSEKSNSDHTHTVATTSSAGFMSASDKSKLDSVTPAVAPSTLAAVIGETITWTVDATGGVGNKEYYFKLYRGSTCLVITSWAQNPSFSYTATVAGNYAAIAHVRDGAGTYGGQKTSAVTTVTDQPDISFTGVTPRLASASMVKSMVSVALPVAGWSGNSQSVTVHGVTTGNAVVVSPDPASRDVYADAGVCCSAQGVNNLTFSCSSTPASALTVNILILT